MEVSIPLATQWKILSHHVQVLSLEWLLVSCLDDFPEHTMCHLPQEWVSEDGFVVTDLMLIEKKKKQQPRKQCNKVNEQQSRWNKSPKRNDVSAENQI